MRALLAFILCAACHSGAPEPCSFDNPEFAALVATCRARVELECRGVADAWCKPLQECDAEIDRRCGP